MPHARRLAAVARSVPAFGATCTGELKYIGLRMHKTLALLAFTACADRGATTASVDSRTDSPADVAAERDSGGHPESDVDAGIDAPSGMPAMLVLGASSGNVTNAFRLAATGTAGSPYGAISISADTGTVDVGGGPAAAFVYATVPEGGYTLYDGFAVTPTSWDAFYLYCNGTTLADVYDEKISGHGMVYAPVTGGACSATTTQTTAHVALPAFTIATPAPIAGYTVTGNAIDIAADGTGTLAIGTSPLPLVVFDDVDCSACGGAGWFELHSIVWDAAAQRATFVIVYLINGNASTVELAYARSLPDLGDPIGTITPAGTWTVPESPRASARHGVPPP